MAMRKYGHGMCLVRNGCVAALEAQRKTVALHYIAMRQFALPLLGKYLPRGKDDGLGPVRNAPVGSFDGADPSHLLLGLRVVDQINGTLQYLTAEGMPVPPFAKRDQKWIEAFLKCLVHPGIQVGHG